VSGTAEPEYSVNYGVFNAFARVMRRDFVGLPEPERQPAYQGYLEDYAQKVWNGGGHTVQFVEQLDSYVRAFGVPAARLVVDHTLTPHYPAFTWGMRVRAWGDALYVTSALSACPFEPGDAITHASMYGEPTFAAVASLRRRFGTALCGREPERELWDPLLHHARRFLVAGEGDAPAAPAARPALPGALRLRVADAAHSRRVEPDRLPVPAPRAPFELAEGDGGAVVLTLHDLSDGRALAAWVEGHRAVLDGARRLVVDVRACTGGPDEALLPLVPYVVDAPTSLAPFMETTCLTNYSANNVARELALLDGFCAAYPGEEAWAAATRTELGQKSGAGLVEEPVGLPDACRAEVAPAGRAAQVCLLTDVGTCDAAETLAEVCRASGRAAVVGRATRGSRGYFNGVEVKEGAYTLVYPMSRHTDEGLARRFFGVGVPPEVAVPWTPGAVGHDPDLAAARGLMG
jgi:hypothetical protein